MFIFTNTFLKYCFHGLIVLLLAIPLAYAKDSSKWVDKEGQIHYGDSVPREFLRSEHSRLNAQGVIVHQSDAIKSEAELAEEYKLNKIKAAEEREKLVAARIKALRDRVLLDTFTTVNDLVLVRDARLEALDSQISLANTLIKHDEVKLKNAQQRIEEITQSKRNIPENLLKEISSVRRQLESNYDYVKDKANERNQIINTFAEDFIRFRELMAEKKEARKREAEAAQAREDNLRF